MKNLESLIILFIIKIKKNYVILHKIAIFFNWNIFNGKNTIKKKKIVKNWKKLDFIKVNLSKNKQNLYPYLKRECFWDRVSSKNVIFASACWNFFLLSEIFSYCEAIQERTEKPKVVDILIRQRNANFLSHLYISIWKWKWESWCFIWICNFLE